MDEVPLGAALRQDGNWRDYRMRVIHVVPVFPEEAAGPSYSVPGLCVSPMATECFNGSLFDGVCSH